MLNDADTYGHVTSRYYDAVYGQLRADVGDVEFYRDLGLQAMGPVLELGCGTGRALLPVAQAGIPCTGVDGSPRMLDALRRKEPPPTLRLACQTMQEFNLGQDRFMLIYSAFRGFQHLYTVEDQLACLRSIKHHLAPGGTLAFDVFSPDLSILSQIKGEEEQDALFEQDGEEIARFTTTRVDLAEQILNLGMRYERRQNGEAFDNESVELRMRYYFRFELEHLLARVGFEELELFGGFDRSPFTSESQDMIILAR